MYLYEYKKSRKDPYMILYNPISKLTLDYIAGKWWFVDLLSNYGYEGTKSVHSYFLQRRCFMNFQYTDHGGFRMGFSP